MFNNKIYLKNVVTLSYNANLCNGCKMCVDVCPHGVFSMLGKKAYITNRDKCMECGACALNCKENAITVNRGVGCATAVINSMINGKEATCGCGPTCG